mgnify:CR=1 FL=1
MTQGGPGDKFLGDGKVDTSKWFQRTRNLEQEIKNGDNRIIIYNGIIEKNVLTRFPAKDDFRANLACGLSKIRLLHPQNIYIISLNTILRKVSPLPCELN